MFCKLEDIAYRGRTAWFCRIPGRLDVLTSEVSVFESILAHRVGLNDASEIEVNVLEGLDERTEGGFFFQVDVDIHE